MKSQVSSGNDLMASILVVEDELYLRDLFRDILVHQGCFRVECVADAITAKNRIENNRYDLAIIDVRLPIVSGVDLIKEIRSANILIPVIITSAYNVQDQITSALQYEATLYLPKPITIDGLLTTVKTLLQ